MVKAEGIFPDPLCFRRLEVPENPVGDAVLDKLRGVNVVDVFEDTAECEGFMGKPGLKLRCNPCKSGVESDCLKIFGPIGWPPAMSIAPGEKAPAPDNGGALGKEGSDVGIGGGAL